MTVYYNPVDLYTHQGKLVDDSRTAYAGGYRAPLIRLATGGGKTRVFTHIAHGITARQKEVVAVAHRKELIEQISMTFAQFGIPHRLIAARATITEITIAQFKKFGKSFVDIRAKAVVASAQTLVNCLTEINPAYLIIDEGHHCTEGSTWGSIVAAFPLARLLIMTATPARLDGKGLGVGQGGYADIMLHGPEMRWLIDNGFLSDFVCYMADVGGKMDFTVDASGDYRQSQTSAEYGKKQIIGRASDHYLQHGSGMPFVTFCTSVKNAEMTAAQYRDRGIKAESVDGSLSSTERSRRIKGLADGSIEVLTSADLIGEGLDIPGIIGVQFLRPTESLSLFLQMVGRALRVMPGKEHAKILDHVGNIGRIADGYYVKKHGLPDEERIWTLDGVSKSSRSASSSEDVNITTCGKCFAIILAAPVCPQCGSAITGGSGSRRGPKQVDGSLIQLTDKHLLKQQKEEDKKRASMKRRQEEYACNSLEDMTNLAKQRGYDNPSGWAWMRWKTVSKNKKPTNGQQLFI